MELAYSIYDCGELKDTIYCVCVSFAQVTLCCYRLGHVIAERVSVRQLLRVVFSRYAYVRRQLVTLRNVK